MSALLRDVRSGWQRQWRRASRWWSAPVIDGQEIGSALRRLSASPQLVMVHSSLSACGTIDGGAETVIRALREWVGGGTLAMPAHSYCYPSATTEAPVFDRTVTPSVVGAITDAYWRRAGVVRSLHPTHSLAADGPAAGMIVEGHEQCDTPCGPRSPYERLVTMNAAVLMFGTGMHAYTLFHTAEDAAMVPYLYQASPVTLRYRTADGRQHAMTMRRHDMHVARSFEAKSSWLEEQGLLSRVPLGRGELLFIREAQSAHAALVNQLRSHPRFLLAAAAA